MFRKSKLGSLLAAFCVISIATGCSGPFQSQNVLYERLSERGPVLIAADNPYLPANRLLSYELDSSSEVREFVNRRGPPTAIAVNRGILSGTELSLIYPLENEIYKFQRKPTGWVIGGPQPLQPDVRAALENEINSSSGGDSTFASVIDSDSTSEEREPTRARYTGMQSSRGVTRKVVATAAPVKIMRNGTLNHTVTFPGETLTMLSLWYTGSAANIKEISKASHIRVSGYLKIGGSVVVPARLVRNKKALTRSAWLGLTKSR